MSVGLFFLGGVPQRLTERGLRVDHYLFTRRVLGFFFFFWQGVVGMARRQGQHSGGCKSILCFQRG